MAYQLLVARSLSISFGIGLDAWAIILASSLLGLALGYFIGGNISKKNSTKKQLIFNIVVACFLLLLFYFFGQNILSILITLPKTIGLILFSLVLIIPINIAFGSITPIIINELSHLNPNSHHAGKVYGISTAGGITSTFLFGLYFIPFQGVNISSILLAAFLFLSILPLILEK